MADLNFSLPVTTVSDPAVAGLVSAGTISVINPGDTLLQVHVVGTLPVTLNIGGSISADIGNVKLTDDNANVAVIPKCSDAKNGNTTALVVQHIDDSGDILREVTQTSILTQGSNIHADVQAMSAAVTTGNSLLTIIHNAQGTQATSALQTTGNTIAAALLNTQGSVATSDNQTTEIGLLTLVLNNQGSQATSASQTAAQSVAVILMNGQGTLATSALQTSGQTVAIALLNVQGTQATSALQNTGNTVLTALMNDQGTLATSALQITTLNNQGTQATAALQIVTLNNQGTQATAALQTTGNAALTVTMNSQGTQATSALQTAGNTTLTSTLRELQQPGYRDAFGRARVSTPTTLFDSKLLLDAAPNFWDDQQVSGTGTSSTYDHVNAKVTLAVSNTTAGSRHRQTLRRFNYQPGKSQLILMTFTFGAAATGITRRAGYFSDFNGIYLEQVSTGPSLVILKNGSASQSIAQASWNGDKLDGNGTSGITLDLSKSQIFWIDFEWLGVGTVRAGFVIGGVFILCHTFSHANSVTNVYMGAPNLPLRYELTNSGAGGAATLDCICGSVMAEGGSERAGMPRAVDRGVTALVTGNDTNVYPIIGLRTSAAGTNISLQPTDLNMTCTSTAVIHYELRLNPLFAGSVPTWGTVANSGAEFAAATTNATTVVASTGTLIRSGYVDSNQPLLALNLPSYLSLGVNIAGVRDELWVCAARLTGTTESIYASINFTEQ